MKYYLTVLLFTFFAVASCRKDATVSRNLSPDTFPGTYQWVLSSGGIAGITETPASTGHNFSCVFMADSTLLYIHGSDTMKGTYRTMPGNVLVVHGVESLENDQPYTYRHHLDSLDLTPGCCDRFGVLFIRK